MSGHVTAEDLEQYVVGALDTASAAWVEAHASACAECAAALRTEAALEIALFEVAELPPPARRRRARVATVVTALGALAAGVVWVVALRPGPAGEAQPRIARCEDVRSAADCIARAQHDGVLTIGPNHSLLVPRYDSEGVP